MYQLLSVALASAFTLLTVAATSPSLAHIHGRVVSVDVQHGTFEIHHDPFPAMPMAMTMEVRAKNPAAVRGLHAGETITATVDTSTEPWVVTDIRPAPAATPAGHP